VAGPEPFGDDHIERRSHDLIRRPAEQPGGSRVPEHDDPVRVADDHRVGQIANESGEDFVPDRLVLVAEEMSPARWIATSLGRLDSGGIRHQLAPIEMRTTRGAVWCPHFVTTSTSATAITASPLDAASIRRPTRLIVRTTDSSTTGNPGRS
jgi:hypothetical protein